MTLLGKSPEAGRRKRNLSRSPGEAQRNRDQPIRWRDCSRISLRFIRATRRPHSMVRPAFWISGTQRLISDWTYSRKPVGVLVASSGISRPSGASRARKVVSWVALRIDAFNRSTIGCGVPLGARKPSQTGKSRPSMPNSLVEGTSGRVEIRADRNTASGRTVFDGFGPAP